MLDILYDAFGNFADILRTQASLSSDRFDANGCFVALENEVPVGWVAATSLPRDKWFVIRYLSVEKSTDRTGVAENLLDRAIRYVESKKPGFLRATTPAVQPYVNIYRKLGFMPLRRDFRISWQIDDLPQVEDNRIETEEVADSLMESAADVYVRALSPYWNWRTEEEGGSAAVARSFKADRSRGARWLLANADRKPVGLVGIIPDYYDKGVGWFRGAFVVPENRGSGIGRYLMSEIRKFARVLRQRRMIVYTFSYLDCLAPGALLYLRSGGRIEADYLQLTRT